LLLLIILGHLVPIIFRKHHSTNVCNGFVIWVVTFQVYNVNSSTYLTLLLNICVLDCLTQLESKF
jgi:MFS superfamily sulfate permease-like transporter